MRKEEGGTRKQIQSPGDLEKGVGQRGVMFKINAKLHDTSSCWGDERDKWRNPQVLGHRQ